jgi:chromosome segregation ATPase
MQDRPLSSLTREQIVKLDELRSLKRELEKAEAEIVEFTRQKRELFLTMARADIKYANFIDSRKQMKGLDTKVRGKTTRIKSLKGKIGELEREIG